MRICATLCYVQRGGKTLMLHRIKKPNDIHDGRWNGLGGKMELEETPEECVAREVWEESGLKIKNPQLRGVLTFPGFDDENDWIVFLFTARKFTGKMRECDEGVLRWIPDKDLTHLHLWDGDRHFLQWLKKKNFFSAKFVYRKGQLKDYNVQFY
ncbi:MAG: 8-oxo-dGTP diphosphatase [Elusimicrobia bacterium]|nr:8-oxo-dGTP diphosphatase [Elusimicrobiota bacterium]